MCPEVAVLKPFARRNHVFWVSLIASARCVFYEINCKLLNSPQCDEVLLKIIGAHFHSTEYYAIIEIWYIIWTNTTMKA